MVLEGNMIYSMYLNAALIHINIKNMIVAYMSNLMSVAIDKKISFLGLVRQ